MEEILKKLDRDYRELIGDYVTGYSYGYIPVQFHGCQILDEFLATWVDLAGVVANTDSEEVSFLEVGAYKGLWPLMFKHICEYYNKRPNYSTVTWMQQDPNNHPLSRVKDFYSKSNYTFNLVDGNSIDASTKNNLLEVTGKNKFNIVFIDADHRYEYVKRDIELYANLTSDVLFFHDIKPRIKNANCGVYQAIIDSNIVLDKEHSTNEHIMGLGLKFYK
jgi:hypothetical protein